ncbi:MAG TPA: GntR family transcriptional regulator [Desulfosporosinus sp.]|nr:GntR family transcriptional regulator [Desulfosporosinus sp.]
MTKFQRISIPENLTEIAYQEIKERILNFDLKPGYKITQEELSSVLGISTTPIREAIKRLEVEGLIQIIPRVGAYVSKFSEKDVVDTYNLREMLEGFAGKLSCSLLKEEDFEHLQILVTKAREAARAKAIIPYSANASDFHLYIVEKCGNERLITFYKNIYSLIKIIRYQNLQLPNDIDVDFKEHINIINVLQNENPEKVEYFLREHVRGVKERILKLIEINQETDFSIRN